MTESHWGKDKKAQFEVNQDNNRHQYLVLIGSWTIEYDVPLLNPITDRLDESKTLRFQTDGLIDWDSMLLTRLRQLFVYCQSNGITVEGDGLPTGARRLIQLASTVPERKDLKSRQTERHWIDEIGLGIVMLNRKCGSGLSFLGELTLALIIFFKGKARYRRKDLIAMLAHCGPKALPIVTLIAILVGLILAFVGAVQFRHFGAQIYVANLVGLGMTREMGAMMTAVIMAGRTGAAFAAQLGSMHLNEEIDALKTMGISAMEFLVLPRLLALITMLPLLSLYADFMGIAGGFIVAVGLLNISLSEYYQQTVAAMGLNDFSVGFIKSVIFGVIVAISGCIRGMHCERNAESVGKASTSAVVTSIVAIVIADAIMTILYDSIGI